MASGQNTCSRSAENAPRRVTASSMVVIWPGYDGLDNIRTKAFSVSGQVAHPSLRLTANHLCAAS